MKLLEKETFYYKFNDRLIEPVECAFFTEENYKGYASHQEAVLAYLTYMNRKWSIQVPQLVPGLKQKLDQVPDVEITRFILESKEQSPNDSFIFPPK